MTSDPNPRLHERFLRLAEPPDDGDWADVVHRARRMSFAPRRLEARRPLALAVALLALLAIAGGALAVSGVSTGVPAIDRFLDRAPSPPLAPEDGRHDPGVGAPPSVPAPIPDPRPLDADSVSPPFEVILGDGSSTTAVGYRSRDDAVCAAYAEAVSASQPSGSLGCLGERILRDALAQSPGRVIGGGVGRSGLELQGVAREDVGAITASAAGQRIEASLSPPWKPTPGAPAIRMFFVFLEVPPGNPSDPPARQPVNLQARLDDGRTVPLETWQSVPGPPG